MAASTVKGVDSCVAAAFEGKTVFFITHQLTTIRNADIILTMDRGLVTEVGDREQLMTLKGRYYCLYQHQEVLLNLPSNCKAPLPQGEAFSGSRTP